jgi:hypothetical protein
MIMQLIESYGNVIQEWAQRYRIVAEGVGFEPTEPLSSTVFKTVAIDHSATLPARIDIMP